jgi:hypothetical protein
MKTMSRVLVALAVAALLAGSAVAQDAKKPGGQKSPKVPAIFNFPAEIQLSEEQQAKLKELITQFQPKLQELAKKSGSVLTAEQRQAEKDVRAKAKAEGKKGKEIEALVKEALKLTAEQQATMDLLAKEKAQLTNQINEAKLALLTEEQKAKLPKKGAKKPKTEGDVPAKKPVDKKVGAEKAQAKKAQEKKAAAENEPTEKEAEKKKVEEQDKKAEEKKGDKE